MKAAQLRGQIHDCLVRTDEVSQAPDKTRAELAADVVTRRTVEQL